MRHLNLHESRSYGRTASIQLLLLKQLPHTSLFGHSAVTTFRTFRARARKTHHHAICGVDGVPHRVECGRVREVRCVPQLRLRRPLEVDEVVLLLRKLRLSAAIAALKAAMSPFCTEHYYVTVALSTAICFC